ncbi:hypothetical protein [Acetobacter fabarum]|nr:hypothetical protein [Acetobacter fabarum]
MSGNNKSKIFSGFSMNYVREILCAELMAQQGMGLFVVWMMIIQLGCA